MPFSDPSSPLVGATSRTKAAQYELRNAWPQDDGSADEIIGAGHGDAGTRCAASARHLACIYRPIETGHEGVWVVDAIRVGTKLRARLHCEVCLA